MLGMLAMNSLAFSYILLSCSAAANSHMLQMASSMSVQSNVCGWLVSHDTTTRYSSQDTTMQALTTVPEQSMSVQLL